MKKAPARCSTLFLLHFIIAATVRSKDLQALHQEKNHSSSKNFHHGPLSFVQFFYHVMTQPFRKRTSPLMSDNFPFPLLSVCFCQRSNARTRLFVCKMCFVFTRTFLLCSEVDLLMLCNVNYDLSYNVV